MVYLGHESHAVLTGGAEVPADQRDLHLSQEGIAAEAAMMPDGDGQGACEQLRAADWVLLVWTESRERAWIKDLIRHGRGLTEFQCSGAEGVLSKSLDPN